VIEAVPGEHVRRRHARHGRSFHRHRFELILLVHGYDRFVRVCDGPFQIIHHFHLRLQGIRTVVSGADIHRRFFPQNRGGNLVIQSRDMFGLGRERPHTLEFATARHKVKLVSRHCFRERNQIVFKTFELAVEHVGQRARAVQHSTATQRHCQNHDRNSHDRYCKRKRLPVGMPG